MNCIINLNSQDKSEKFFMSLYKKSLLKYKHLLNYNTDIYELLSIAFNHAIIILDIKHKFGSAIRENDPYACDFCVLCSSYIELKQLKRTLFCDHTFHKKCIDKVIFKHLYNKCPCCNIIL